MRMRHIVICDLSSSTAIPRYLIKWHNFRKQSYGTWNVFWFSLHLLSANIYHFKKNWVRYDQKCILVYNKSTCNSYSILIKLEFLDRFSKSNQVSDLMKIHPAGGELFHANRPTDGRTDRHDEVNNCFSQFCERAFDWGCGWLKLRKTEIPKKKKDNFFRQLKIEDT
jgi:hypothetical protein